MKCTHKRAGYTVRARGGILFRWCADCGAAGVTVPCPGRTPFVIGWVRPTRNGGAEEELEELIRRGRKGAQMISAGAIHVDSPLRGTELGAARPMRGEAGLTDRAIAQLEAYDHDAPPGAPPPRARARRARTRKGSR